MTLATADAGPPVFTPNGDGLSDSIAISHRLSENAFVEVVISRGDTIVRRTTTWSLKGPGRITWDGRKDNGDIAGEGTCDGADSRPRTGPATWASPAPRR